MTNYSPLFEREPLLFGLIAPGTPQTLELAEEVYESFLKLKEMALKDGIEIAILCSWRDFEKQKSIWNKKACGERTLLSDKGVPLPFENLSSKEVVSAILRWSAFPGLSRHHWGTDLDIYDEIALTEKLKSNPDYKVELVPSEYAPGGPFEKLGNFLYEHLTQSDFFRPYNQDRGGVAIEPWHLSHNKSKSYLNRFTLKDFQDFLESPHCEDIVHLEIVKKQAKAIFEKYCLNVANGL